MGLCQQNSAQMLILFMYFPSNVTYSSQQHSCLLYSHNLLALSNLSSLNPYMPQTFLSSSYSYVSSSSNKMQKPQSSIITLRVYLNLNRTETSLILLDYAHLCWHWFCATFKLLAGSINHSLRKRPAETDDVWEKWSPQSVGPCCGGRGGWLLCLVDL